MNRIDKIYVRKGLLGLLLAFVSLSLLAAPKWTLDSSEPTWWFTQSAWSEWPVSGAVTIGNGSKGGERSFIYLQDGDVVSGITDLVLGNANVQNRHDVLQVRTGAVLRYTGTMKCQTKHSTNVLDVAGGTIVGNVYHPGGASEADASLSQTVITNGGILALNGSTTGWVGPSEVMIDDGTILVTNGNWIISNGHRVDLKANRARLESKALNLAANGNNSTAYLSLTDSVWTNHSELSVIAAKTDTTCVWALTNTVFNSGRCAVKFCADGVPSSSLDFTLAGEKSEFVVEDRNLTVGGNTHMTIAGGELSVSYNVAGGSATPLLIMGLADTVQTLDLSGGRISVTNRLSRGEYVAIQGSGTTLIRQTGGVFDAGHIYFGVDAAGGYPRYEISGGKLLLEYWPGGVGTAGMTMGTNTKLPVLSVKGAHQTVRTTSLNGQICYEYVLDQTGFNPLTIVNRGVSAQSWIKGYLDVKFEGGVQLLHTNAVELVRSTMKHVRFDDTANANTDLWQTSPRAQGDGSFFDQTGCAGVVLLDSAELTSGTSYGAGRACGFIRLPRIKTEQTKSVTAKLKLVPQGDVTLASLLEGFTAAGYAATALDEADYNVALDVPVSLIRDRSADERLAFDFTSYATPDDLKSGTPVVRALVQRAKIEKQGPGLMIILR